MRTARHCRVVSTDLLKPCKKPVTISFDTGKKKLDTTREDIRNQVSKERTTLYTEGIRGHDEMAYSYSFDDNASTQYEYERELFSRFLQSKHLQWMAILSSMLEINPDHLVTFVKIGEEAQTVHDNRIMAHYIGVWLLSMGYAEPQTKKRILQNVELMFDEMPSAPQIAELMYDRLFQGQLPADLQMKALLETCQRGWEYFTFLICRIIKILKKLNSRSNLYEQLQNAIDNK